MSWTLDNVCKIPIDFNYIKVIHMQNENYAFVDLKKMIYALFDKSINSINLMVYIVSPNVYL